MGKKYYYGDKFRRTGDAIRAFILCRLGNKAGLFDMDSGLPYGYYIEPKDELCVQKHELSAIDRGASFIKIVFDKQ